MSAPSLCTFRETADQTPFGKGVLLQRKEGKCILWLRGMKWMQYAQGDASSERLAMASLATNKLASQAEIGRVFGRHRNQVGKYVKQFRAGQPVSLATGYRGGHGDYKVTPAVRAFVAERVSDPQGQTTEQVLEALEKEQGVRLGRTRYFELKKELREEVALPKVSVSVPQGKDSSSPEKGTQRIQVKERPLRRAQESGRLPSESAYLDWLRESHRQSYAGLLLYAPFVEELSLPSLLESLYPEQGNEEFAPVDWLMTLFYATLLGHDTVESLKTVRKQDLGLLLGQWRAPSVGTLRQGLPRVVEAGQSATLLSELAQRYLRRKWIGERVFYLDGHFVPYYGKAKMPKGFSVVRNQPLKGRQAYSVSDRLGRPLWCQFYDGYVRLPEVLPTVIDKLRELTGRQRLTVVVDRAANDVATLKSLPRGITFITYGSKRLEEDQVPPYEDADLAYRFRTRKMGVAERWTDLPGYGSLRQVILDKKSRSPIPIWTNEKKRSAGEVAELIVNRWSQENGFKTGKYEFGLDRLTTYKKESFTALVEVKNPERKRLTQDRKRLQTRLRRVNGQLSKYAPKHEDQRLRRSKKRDELWAEKERLDAENKSLLARMKEVPDKIAVTELPDADAYRQFTFEQKHVITAVQTAAYNVNQCLCASFLEHYEDTRDYRPFLRAVTESPGTVRLQDETLLVELDVQLPRHPRRCAARLCQVLNSRKPRTADRHRFRLHFSVANCTL